MAGQTNAVPAIIKRKKIVQGGGHHGGAWKVAYADFVTALMAFFLLMWLLNATTEKQRKGISDYFNPTIPVNRISGGGDGPFGGDSLFSEDVLANDGIGAPGQAKDSGESAEQALGQAELEAVEKALLARGGESHTTRQLLRHVVTRVTDEGLVIELFDLPGAPLFDDETARPMPVTLAIADLLAEVLSPTTNEIAINGHVRAYPVMLVANPVWDLSAGRAKAMRAALEEAGLTFRRLQRVTGFADRKPTVSNPTADRNNRIEVILLRSDR